MSRVTADGVATPAEVAAAGMPAPAPGSNRAAAQVLAEIELWSAQFAHGELHGGASDRYPLAAGERFAVQRPGVRAAGGGHAAISGDLHATDRRALVFGDRRRDVREWTFAELAEVRVLGNWGGLTLVYPGGDTELIVTATPQAPVWRDAIGWLKVEGAFAAGRGRLEHWRTGLPHRLAVVEAV
jgi:hypothetical protein